MPSASARRATQLLLLEPLQLDLLLVELVLQRLELLITLRCRRLLQPLLIDLLLLLVQTKLKGAQLLGCRASRLRKGRNRERRSHEDNEALHETGHGRSQRSVRPAFDLRRTALRQKRDDSSKEPGATSNTPHRATSVVRYA